MYYGIWIRVNKKDMQKNDLEKQLRLLNPIKIATVDSDEELCRIVITDDLSKVKDAVMPIYDRVIEQYHRVVEEWLKDCTKRKIQKYPKRPEFPPINLPFLSIQESENENSIGSYFLPHVWSRLR